MFTVIGTIIFSFPYSTVNRSAKKEEMEDEMEDRRLETYVFHFEVGVFHQIAYLCFVSV